MHLSLTGMTLSVQIKLLKGDGKSVHNFTAQTKRSGMQFWLLNQHLGGHGCHSIEKEAVLGDSHIANVVVDVIKCCKMYCILYEYIL